MKTLASMKVSVETHRGKVNDDGTSGSCSEAFAPPEQTDDDPASQPTEAIDVQVSRQIIARVVVSPQAFRRWWIAVVTIHCLCGVFLGYVGALYLYLVDSSVAEDFNSYSMAVDAVYFPAVAKMYFVLSSIHGLLVTLIVLRSIQARQLVFRKPKSKPIPPVSRNASTKIPSTRRMVSQDSTVSQPAVQSRRMTLSRKVPLVMRHFWKLLRTVFAAFDVRNKHYGLVFLMREISLTALQTYQTYRLSCLVPRLWMNNVMISLLVLNCWATPMLQYLVHSDVGHIRLYGALMNMMLDMASHIGLPTALFLPYASQLNKDIKQFDRIYWYSDVWLIEMINEAQMLFVTSLYDAMSKFLIALSVARGLYAITKLICTADAIGPTEVVAGYSRNSLDMTSVVPFTDMMTNPIPVARPRLSWKSRLDKIGHQLLFLWGLSLLIIHLQAASLSDHPQCRLSIRPWFHSQPSCALLEFNCAEERATGSEAEIDWILRTFDPESIEHLVIRHCPLLVLPHRIQMLHELLGLKVFNSTILEWSEAAAITNSHHPELRFLFIVDTKMREFPVGLQSLDFPKRLRDVEFSKTNLSVIPDNLDTIWSRGMDIAFEECQLQEIPLVLLRMQPHDLGIALNNITSVPLQVLEGYPLRLLLLDGNPIQSFPSTLTEPPRIIWFDLIGTSISVLPGWMDEAFLASVYIIAANTPLCDRLIAAGEASEQEPRALLGIFGIDCSFAYVGNGSLNWYPIDHETTINPSYSLA